MFYGRSGSGKTTVTGTFPKPVLIMDVNDHGDDSLGDIPENELKVTDITEWDDVVMIYWWLKKNPNKYKTVVIDTVSQLQQMAITKVVGDKAADMEKAPGDWGTMTKKDWGQVASLLKTLLTDYRNLSKPKAKGGLGLEVVFIAQDRTFNIEEDDAEVQLDPEVGPALMPSVVKTMNAQADVIGNTYIREKSSVKKIGRRKKSVKKIQYCMRLGPNAVYLTKMRKPKGVKLPSLIVDPSYDKILKAMSGE